MVCTGQGSLLTRLPGIQGERKSQIIAEGSSPSTSRSISMPYHHSRTSALLFAARVIPILSFSSQRECHRSAILGPTPLRTADLLFAAKLGQDLPISWRRGSNPDGYASTSLPSDPAGPLQGSSRLLAHVAAYVLISVGWPAPSLAPPSRKIPHDPAHNLPSPSKTIIHHTPRQENHHSHTHTHTHSHRHHLRPSNMAHSHTMLSIAQILGLFFCAHHFWPKGTTYRKAGGDWEKSYRRRHAQGHSRSTKRGRKDSGTSSNDEHVPKRRGDGRRERHHEYEDERRRHSRHASSRY
ncbi:hypothetical protein MBM_01140 [Drepanopeziza brunnea f. sp. 'multigermtubi' MB_m1]|uniref:Uncharacterized protein n=1 Tax=Marssonina brunnea f. sp. multigermtubi (strain MB_m1) TaxID=1072389 RepID=K1XI91_MARBU|nr:uncharacterized protein MBM_01140 [Drepanopeziza brunnea f. sp. 'multigermtubi' MB_m1]EKD20458.1 hypothetical protein MBM_01140 [Drepanopeziza brunnea f. sp. 'multigermtubi' MB_m1]